MSKVIRHSGQTVTVPGAVPAGNEAVPSRWDLLLEWEADEPIPVDLQLDVRLVVSAGGGFPEVLAINYCAGALYTLGGGGPVSWDASPEGCVVLKIECGAGPDPRVLYADCRSGRYSLGSQKWVRVSVARWLAAGGSSTSVRGAVAPSDGSGDYLTYSAAIAAVDPATSVGLPVVPGALWFEFYPEAGASFEGFSTDSSTCNWSARRETVAAAPVYSPPGSPLPLLGSNGIALSNVGLAPAGVYLTFWVR